MICFYQRLKIKRDKITVYFDDYELKKNVSLMENSNAVGILARLFSLMACIVVSNNHDTGINVKVYYVNQSSGFLFLLYKVYLLLYHVMI